MGARYLVDRGELLFICAAWHARPLACAAIRWDARTDARTDTDGRRTAPGDGSQAPRPECA